MEDIEHLSTPQLRYIGLQPSDIEALQIPDEAKLPLTQRDRSLVDTLASRPFITQNQLLHDQVKLSHYFETFPTRSYVWSYVYARSSILFRDTHHVLLYSSVVGASGWGICLGYQTKKAGLVKSQMTFRRFFRS